MLIVKLLLLVFDALPLVVSPALVFILEVTLPVVAVWELLFSISTALWLLTLVWLVVVDLTVFTESAPVVSIVPLFVVLAAPADGAVVDDVLLVSETLPMSELWLAAAPLDVLPAVVFSLEDTEPLAATCGLLLLKLTQL